MMRTLAAIAVFLVTVGTTMSAAAEPSHVRVVWHTDPANTAIISWSTPDEDQKTRVKWHVGPDPAPATLTAAMRPQSSGQYVDDESIRYHHARLDDLPASTRVDFEITTDSGESKRLWFRTAPKDDRPFALLYGGDSRSDSAARKAMNRRIGDLVRSDRTIIALAHGGDYIYSGDSWPQWRKWLDDWQEVVTDDGQIIPIIPARGNHEGDGELYNIVFGFPGGENDPGDWFTTQVGVNFVLINLDSNVSQAGVQRQWLEQTLKDAQRYRWIAANYHRPAYPAVKSPGGAYYHWVPLFEQYNVDFVLESDGHVLKRTVPIRDDKHDATGVVYLGEGGLGVPQRTPRSDRWYLQPPGMASSAHHVQALRVTPERVYYTAIGMDGTVLDKYEFEPRRLGTGEKPTTEVVELPIGPPAEEASAFWVRLITMSRWEAIQLFGIVGLFVVVLGGLTWARRRRRSSSE